MIFMYGEKDDKDFIKTLNEFNKPPVFPLYINGSLYIYMYGELIKADDGRYSKVLNILMLNEEYGSCDKCDISCYMDDDDPIPFIVRSDIKLSSRFVHFEFNFFIAGDAYAFYDVVRRGIFGAFAEFLCKHFGDENVIDALKQAIKETS